ncbi:hypothetical protein [Nocardia panacis]|nr:hypothetical protein [Nocardia panacis]
MVQVHAYQQPGNPDHSCWLTVYHDGFDAGGGLAWQDVWGATFTSGRDTRLDGPDWYYGPWNGSGHMCVIFYYGERSTSSGPIRYC